MVPLGGPRKTLKTYVMLFIALGVASGERRRPVVRHAARMGDVKGPRRALLSALLLAVAAGSCRGDNGASGPTTSSSARSTSSTGEEAAARPGWWLVYATRDGAEVSVSRRPVGPGEPEVLFSYREGPFEWPPDVGISPDGRLVAYVVGRTDLHVREVATGDDEVLVTGEPRESAPGDEVTPRWSVSKMNLPPEHHTTFGIFEIATPRLSPDGRSVAFAQGYYEGSDWGFIERDTVRYETSAGAGGDLFFLGDGEVLTVGKKYTEPGAMRRGTVGDLSSSSVVAGGDDRLDIVSGVLSPDGTRAAVVFGRRFQTARTYELGVVAAAGGQVAPVDSATPIRMGFAADGTLVWARRDGDTTFLAREGHTVIPLPEDHIRFGPTPGWAENKEQDDIVAAGPGRVGFQGARLRRCDELPKRPCSGTLSDPFFVVVDVATGETEWRSPDLGPGARIVGLVSPPAN